MYVFWVHISVTSCGQMKTGVELANKWIFKIYSQTIGARKFSNWAWQNRESKSIMEIKPATLQTDQKRHRQKVCTIFHIHSGSTLYLRQTLI